MKKIFISAALEALVLIVSPLSVYANLDFPFTVEEGASSLNDIFEEQYDEGNISELYTIPEEPNTVAPDSHQYLYVAKSDGGTLMIGFKANGDTNHVVEIIVSGGWNASSEFMSEVYPAGVLLADSTMTYEDASDVVAQVLEKESGRYDSGNLEYVIEDGYKLSLYCLEEPAINSDGNTEIQEKVTMGESQALKKAQEYLEVSAFSYDGLVEQLMYDQFSEDEAKYAADKCGADWHEQAIAKAKEYLELSSFSAKGLMEQLQYDGFTYIEAYMAVLSLGYTVE